jgi:5,10-methylenetetrahydromethanopterin reductase
VIIGDEPSVVDRLETLRAAGVDEFVGVVFDRSAEVRARTRALLRQQDD